MTDQWRATLVQLIDGTTVLSDAESWRKETEARHILSMPLETRRQFIESTRELQRLAARIEQVEKPSLRSAA